MIFKPFKYYILNIIFKPFKYKHLMLELQYVGQDFTE